MSSKFPDFKAISKGKSNETLIDALVDMVSPENFINFKIAKSNKLRITSCNNQVAMANGLLPLQIVALSIYNWNKLPDSNTARPML